MTTLARYFGLWEASNECAGISIRQDKPLAGTYRFLPGAYFYYIRLNLDIARASSYSIRSIYLREYLTDIHSLGRYFSKKRILQR